MKNFINSVWFNVILATLAAVFIILQEVWLGGTILKFNVATLGIFAGIGFSFSAEAVKILFAEGRFNAKFGIVGSVFGALAAIITTLLI